MRERLQKILAQAGIASRRKAEQLILDGRVTVNGQRVSELGTKADLEEDHIKVDGKLIRREAYVYYAVNKPQGVICAVSDPRGRKVINDLIPSRHRVYPAGRLDFDSEGLVILTNDGGLAQTLTEAGRIAKVYRVKVSGMPSKVQIDRLRKGFQLNDGTRLAPCEIKLLKRAKNCWYQVTLRQGKNRQIRRMFEDIGHRVMRLRRVSIGSLLITGLKIGMFRRLKSYEVRSLISASSPKVRQARV